MSAPPAVLIAKCPVLIIILPDVRVICPGTFTTVTLVVRRSVTCGLQPNPPPTRLQSFISHSTSPCTRPLADSAAAVSDCAPPGCVIAPRTEHEKARLFGRRSWLPPASVCPQPPPRPVCGATLCRRCQPRCSIVLYGLLGICALGMFVP
jgi:hypothetical protein